MQSTPSEARRAGSRTDAPVDATRDSDRDAGLAAVPTRSPTLVLRGRIQLLLAGPALLAIAFVLVATGRRWGVAAVLVALLFVPAFWIRIEVGAHTVRRRTWRLSWIEVPIDDVDTMRLRRLPFAALLWLRRGHRFGRFWTVPLTLRLQEGEDVLLELRCVWWGGWKKLARFVALQPGIDLDVRTRGRLDRYVGVFVPAASTQP